MFSLRELCSQGECRTDKLSNFARCLCEFASSLTEAAIAKAKKEEENSGKFPCMGLGGLCGTAAAFFSRVFSKCLSSKSHRTLFILVHV